MIVVRNTKTGNYFMMNELVWDTIKSVIRNAYSGTESLSMTKSQTKRLLDNLGKI